MLSHSVQFLLYFPTKKFTQSTYSKTLLLRHNLEPHLHPPCTNDISNRDQRCGSMVLPASLNLIFCNSSHFVLYEDIHALHANSDIPSPSHILQLTPPPILCGKNGRGNEQEVQQCLLTIFYIFTAVI